MDHAVESHPQRKAIVEMLLSGVPLRKIARNVTPELSPMALHRYKRAVLVPAAQKITLADQANTASVRSVTGVAAVQPHLARIAQRQADLDAVAGAAVAEGDGRTVAAIATADYKGIELAMRATGLLDAPAAPQVNISIVCPAAGGTVPADPADVLTIDIAPAR